MYKWFATTLLYNNYNNNLGYSLFAEHLASWPLKSPMIHTRFYSICLAIVVTCHVRNNFADIVHLNMLTEWSLLLSEANCFKGQRIVVSQTYCFMGHRNMKLTGYCWKIAMAIRSAVAIYDLKNWYVSIISNKCIYSCTSSQTWVTQCVGPGIKSTGPPDACMEF